jgi:hypothetical protein
MTQNDWIIHWHRRYYSPLTITSLVNMSGETGHLTVDAVQLAIYKYETGMAHPYHGMHSR